MKSVSVLLVVLLAAAATAAVISNEVPDVVVVPDVADGDELADMDMNKMSDVFVTNVDELVDVADLTDGAEEIAVGSRQVLSVGSIGFNDMWLYNNEHRQNAHAGQVHTRDLRIVRHGYTVTAIRVTPIGASQGGTPSIVGGGVGTSFVTIRLQTAVGRGFAYRVVVWGREWPR